MRATGPAIALVTLVAVAMTGCGPAPEMAIAPGPDGASPSAIPAGAPAFSVLEDRMAAIDEAVSRWEVAPDLAAAMAAAEEARNLVVGPGGPGYGDADGDGIASGATTAGLLPGLDGRPGLATEADGACVERDVLGGSWSDPAVRWAILAEAIDAWTPSNNTFPSLPSHPQRVVGWASLALGADDLETALEYAGHARLHVDISMAAVTACR